MRKTLASLLLLSGCSAELPAQLPVAHSSDRTNSPEPSPLRECPTLPPELSISVTGRWAIDALACKAISTSSHETLFNVYIGAHPDNSQPLRYGETTSSKARNLVWFYGPDCRALGPCKWQTFLPTGNSTTPIMVISFTSSDPDDFRRRAELVAQLRQGQ